MKYSAVVVTYNRKEKLIEALNSLLHQTIEPTRIILIDNHSNDGTVDLLDSNGLLGNPKIDYVRMKTNLGGSGGFYEGIKRALNFHDYDFLSISDDDAVFESDYFEKIFDVAQKRTTYKAFTGAVKYEDGSIQLMHRRRIANNKTLKEIVVPEEKYDENFNIDTFSFVGCVISRDVVEQVGLPKKEYFIFYDDTEYSMRIRKITKICNVSNAVIIHKTVKDINSKIIFSWKSYYGIRNQIDMKLTYSNWKGLKIYLILKKYREYLRVLCNKDYKDNRKFILKMIQKGYSDGFNHKLGKNEMFLPGKK